jgi:hypothetical protein
MAKTTEPNRLHQLEDELKAAKARIAELKQERDEGRELVDRLREAAEEHQETMSRWKETFGMVPISKSDDTVTWQWDEAHTISENIRLRDKYNKLVRDFNRRFAPGDVGRPLAASEAACAKVLKLRKDGTPLRLIVDETGLGLQTVRTIIGREDRTDRTSAKRVRKYMPDKAAEITNKWRKRDFDDLPKQVSKLSEKGAALITEAKGLGKH